MSRSTPPQLPVSVVARRIRSLREQAGWSQERLGVEIGLEESSSRARISRYELGVHEPPVPTARLIAAALRVPMPYLYCEDDEIASLLLTLHRLPEKTRKRKLRMLLDSLRKHGPDGEGCSGY